MPGRNDAPMITLRPGGRTATAAEGAGWQSSSTVKSGRPPPSKWRYPAARRSYRVLSRMRRWTGWRGSSARLLFPSRSGLSRSARWIEGSGSVSGRALWSPTPFADSGVLSCDSPPGSPHVQQSCRTAITTATTTGSRSRIQPVRAMKIPGDLREMGGRGRERRPV